MIRRGGAGILELRLRGLLIERDGGVTVEVDFVKGES